MAHVDETEEMTEVFTDVQGDEIEEGVAMSETEQPTHPRRMLIAAFVLGIVGTSLAVIALVVGSLALASGGRGHQRIQFDFEDGPGTRQQLDRGSVDRGRSDRSGMDMRDDRRGERTDRRGMRDGRGWTDIEVEVEEETTQS